MPPACSISSNLPSAASCAPSTARSRQALADDLRARSSRHRACIERLGGRLRRTEWVRLLVFLALPTLAWHGYERGFAPWLWAALVLGLVLFIGMVQRHAKLREAIEHEQHLVTLNQWALARLERDFSALPDCPESLRPLFDKQDLDINLFGPASMGQLLFNQATGLGDRRIAHWLTQPAQDEALRDRQQAITELAGCRDLRQALAAYALHLNARGLDLGRLGEWVAGEDSAGFTPLQVALGRGATVASLVCMGGVLGGGLPAATLLACVGINLVLYALRAKAWHGVFAGADDSADTLNGLTRWLTHVAGQPFASPCLQRLAGQLTVGEAPPARAVRRLDSILGYARLRHNPTIGVFAQAVLLWDFHCALALSRWRRQHRTHLPAWLEVLAELEALSAFAGLADENPGWCFARQVDEPSLTAQGACHPLLHPERAVPNPVALVPGQVTIITGSNMSGKTTYMRTVALNLRLAQAGSVVAAQAFRFGRMRMVSSISVADSLEQGLSYFMSEVLQVKAVIDTVRQSPVPVLYLLDELLKGTNEKERNLAIIEILRTLCAHQALGLLTTHNVALATDPALQGLGCNIYFEEGYEDAGEQGLSFNYQLRHGVSRNTNAIRLLRRMGVLGHD
ncbi:hypothetical protein F3J45_29165 [Pantoea sp. Ap-967]|nr:hypothetical protein [Pantoea sp. Ap-967]